MPTTNIYIYIFFFFFYITNPETLNASVHLITVYNFKFFKGNISPLHTLNTDILTNLEDNS